MSHKKSAENTIIERFHIQAEDGYSEFWRRNKSPTELLELANLLSALRKTASFVGRNVGDIVWSGMDYSYGIALDPSLVMGKYPVPASKTDIMAGVTIQRAFEKTEWSDRVKKTALSQLQLSPDYSLNLDLFNAYLDVCEKVYLDCLSNHSVLGFYTEKARRWKIAERSAEFVHPPSVSELFCIWWAMAADRCGTGYKEDYAGGSAEGLVYGKPLALLNSMVGQLTDECPNINGVSERGDFRLGLYMSIWPGLLEHIELWSNVIRDRKAANGSTIGFGKEIEKILRRKKPDYTDDVRGNVKNVDDVVQIEANDIVMRAEDKIDKILLHNLQLVIKAVAQRKTSYNRGLKSGKIDRRRLYRAPTTGAVFELKKHSFELANDIALLVDATGSMSDPRKWRQTETVYQTLFSAIRLYNRKARVFAYNEVKNICRLTELYTDKEGFFTVLPHGKTASGEAIIATGINLKGRDKKPFIIHITDGASNWGCGVANAIAFCKKNRINLLTLGMGCAMNSKQALRKEYGVLVQFVNNTDELARLFRSLLNHSKWT